MSGAEVNDASKGSSRTYFSTTLFIKTVFYIGKVESSLQESFELVEAQEDCNDAEETESPMGIMLKRRLPRYSLLSNREAFRLHVQMVAKRETKYLSDDDEFFNEEKRKPELSVKH
jgi:hypothetical protein